MYGMDHSVSTLPFTEKFLFSFPVTSTELHTAQCWEDRRLDNFLFLFVEGA